MDQRVQVLESQPLPDQAWSVLVLSPSQLPRAFLQASRNDGLVADIIGEHFARCFVDLCRLPKSSNFHMRISALFRTPFSPKSMIQRNLLNCNTHQATTSFLPVSAPPLRIFFIMHHDFIYFWNRSWSHFLFHSLC